MFTGLIVELGEVVSLERKAENASLSIKCTKTAADARVGDSISVNGVCLTAVDIKGSIIFFDVSYETLKATNLGGLKKPDRLNIEPSLRADSKLGGHFVTGHIDGVGRIKSKRMTGNAIRIEIESPPEILKYLVDKGSAAVDGVSLTVVEVLKDSFSVVIIPHTASITTIGFKNTGDTVNLEADILGKYVAKFLNINSDSSLLSALKKSGYI
jgi:riboflavin synthase